MRVPIRWLQDYVAWQGSAEELAELLSMSGTEVEAVLHVGAPADAENLDLFRVGRVLHKERHPNADKLWLCRVAVAQGWDTADGSAEGSVRQIVCGADNFSVGDMVAVALPGSVLESGLKLRKANLRGVSSEGMMLSEQELGFEEQSAGIVILPDQWAVGDRLAEHLPVAEAVLELEITPNRPDCLSVYGVAREVAAVAGLPLSPPPAQDPPTGGAPAADDIAVEVLAPDLCPRYGARVIRDVTIGESPAWLKARLTHAGMRPISNLVDVTNYAMLALGEPLHAFDRDKIEGRRLIVRRAAAGESITTLDGVDRILTSDMLVIADAVSPSAIAGVMGSEKSEVDASTRHIVLEAATFAGPSIMRTSKTLGLRSEASNRFEKGLDQAYVPQGLALACRLYSELCGGTVAPGMVDVRLGEPEAAPIAYRPAKCDALLGMVVPPAQQAEILRSLGCRVGEAEPRGDVTSGVSPALDVIPPTWRADLEREVDLIEEVGRVYGFQQTPETLPRRRGAVGGLTLAQRLRRDARRTLAATGLYEVITYTFVGEQAAAELDLRPDDPRLRVVRLANPMSAEQAVMRSTLVPGLLTTIRENIDRQNSPVNIFEQGRVYTALDGESHANDGLAADTASATSDELSADTRPATSDAARSAPPAPSAAELQRRGVMQAAGSPGGVMPAREREMLALALTGALTPAHWRSAPAQPDFYTVKGVVQRLLAALGVTDAGYARSQEPYLHPGKSADLLVQGRRVGSLGLLRPDLALAWGVGGCEVYVAELWLDELEAAYGAVRLYEDLIAYPPAVQDLAVVLDATIPAAEVVALVDKAGGKLLREAYVFDVYEGDQVPAGKRSLALRLTMRAPDRTLTDKDITGIRHRVLAALERELGATLR